MHRFHSTGLIFASSLGLLGVVACGGDPPCDETKTCNVDPSGSGGGATSAGGASTTTGSAGGGATTGSGGAGVGGGPDTMPPTVLSVSPGIGEIGVSVDDKLVVTFSEPMNQASTEAAFASPDFGVDTMIWLDATTLEITPTGLAYAAGDPNVMATQYTYQLKGSATDLAGNALGTPFDGDFATLREITDHPPRADQDTVNSQGVNSGCFNQGGRYVGWKNTYCRHLISFDLSAIPNGADVQSASLSCTRYSVVGDPFAQFNTDVILEHVDFPVNNLALGASTTAESTIGVAFSSPTDSIFALNVAPAVETDLMNNKQEVQFRIRLANEVGNPPLADHYVRLNSSESGGCPTDALTLTYVAP